MRGFDNEDLKGDFFDVLYSRKQGSEPAEAYLGEQWALGRRKLPHMPEEMVLNIFKRNLRGSIKAIIGNQRFETAEALRLAAEHVDESLAEKRTASRQMCSPPVFGENLMLENSFPRNSPSSSKLNFRKFDNSKPSTSYRKSSKSIAPKKTYARESSGAVAPRKSLICYACQKEGHYAFGCPQKKTKVEETRRVNIINIDMRDYEKYPREIYGKAKTRQIGTARSKGRKNPTRRKRTSTCTRVRRVRKIALHQENHHRRQEAA